MSAKDLALRLAQGAVAHTSYRLVTGRMPDAEQLARLFTQWSTGILHIGGHLGQESHWYASLGKPVVWFEAMPAAAQRLRTTIAGYADQSVVEACLSDVDGAEIDFHVSANNDGASSSMFEFGSASAGPRSMWPDVDLRMVDTLRLRTSRFDTIVREQALDLRSFDHWIVDVQGAELLVLRGAEQSLSHCRSLVVEASSIDVYSGGAQWPQLRDFLQERGFEPLWECLGHMDVLFVRRDQAWQQPLDQTD